MKANRLFVALFVCMLCAVCSLTGCQNQEQPVNPYITPATEAGGEVQLKFYSPDLKRIFVAKETFTFRNDAQLGSVSEPYTPEWKVTE